MSLRWELRYDDTHNTGNTVKTIQIPRPVARLFEENPEGERKLVRIVTYSIETDKVIKEDNDS